MMKITNDSKIRIANVGVDTFSAGFKTMTDPDALRLANEVCLIMGGHFVNDKQKAHFLAHLGYLLLNQVLKDDFNHDNIIKNIKNGKEFLGKWKMVEKKVNPTKE